MIRPSLELVLLAAVVAFVGLFAIVPALALFALSVAPYATFPALATVLTERGNALPISNSLVQGAASAALAVGIGYPAGVFLGRYRWPGREVLRSFLLLPFLLPTLVMVLGLLDLFGPSGLLSGPVPALRVFASGLPGVVAVNLFYNVPIVVLFTATGCEASSRELEETVASLGGSPARAYVEAWAGPSWVGAASGGLLTFVFSALSYAPPVLLCQGRCDTIEVRIFSLALTLAEPHLAGTLALFAVLIFLAPAVLYLVLLRRLRPSGGRPHRPHAVPWRRPVAWGLAGAFALFVAAELALLSAVLVRSLVPPGGGAPGRGWTLLFAPSTAARLGISVEGAVGNTLFFAALASGLALVLAIATTFIVTRRPRWSTVLGIVVFVPVLLSPVVLAQALASFWRPALGGEADVWLLIVLSQALLALPFALQSLEIPIAGLGVSGRESARALGASGWGAFVDAELPRLRRGIQTALLFAFALGLGEFTATYFLATPTFRTLPIAVFALTSPSLRLLPAAEAAAALLLVLSLGVFALIVAGGYRAEP